MDIHNSTFILFVIGWLSGLIWASIVAFRNRKDKDE